MYDENFYCQYNEANEVFEIIKNERVFIRLPKHFVENMINAISVDKLNDSPVVALIINQLESTDRT
tara:strand:- start:188 stop:385 length:198 start_codon:yes stop_codon:yes gene_type:complete